MSTIKTEVVVINDVRPHPNADALELATVKGWQMVVRKGAHTTGERVVYFEASTVLPPAVAERFGVTSYLSNKLDINGNRVLVVHRVKLRGEPSFGLAVVPDQDWPVGTDVSAYYGTSKFQPPVKTSAGDAEADHPLFPAYTDIENMRSYPDVFEAGERVVATEKLHGSNCRVGFVLENGELVSMAGSRTLRRKRPEGELRASTYWFPWSLPAIVTLLTELREAGHAQAILFGEVYGKGVQSYDYGEPGVSFRAFDLMVDGTYVDYASFVLLCDRAGVQRVPLVYEGPFSLEAIKAVSDGDSLVGGKHGREGVVVRPATERQHPQLGRVVLKYIGDAYLFSKKGGGADDTTDQ